MHVTYQLQRRRWEGTLAQRDPLRRLVFPGCSPGPERSWRPSIVTPDASARAGESRPARLKANSRCQRAPRLRVRASVSCSRGGGIIGEAVDCRIFTGSPSSPVIRRRSGFVLSPDTFGPRLDTRHPTLAAATTARNVKADRHPHHDPSSTSPQTSGAWPAPSDPRGSDPSPHPQPRRCASPCACPSRSRSSAPSLQLG